jgi:hypothetical protein
MVQAIWHDAIHADPAYIKFSVTEFGPMAKPTARPGIDDDGGAANSGPAEAPSAVAFDDLPKNAGRAAVPLETRSAAPDSPRIRPHSAQVRRPAATALAKPNPLRDDPMTRLLCEGFAEAARQAVREAHAEGLAVPARAGSTAVEIRPDGEVVPIDDNAPWSPADWRKSAKY